MTTEIPIVEVSDPPFQDVNPLSWFMNNCGEVVDWLDASKSHYWFRIDQKFIDNKKRKIILMVNIEDPRVAIQYKLSFQKIVIE